MSAQAGAANRAGDELRVLTAATGVLSHRVHPCATLHPALPAHALQGTRPDGHASIPARTPARRPGSCRRRSDTARARSRARCREPAARTRAPAVSRCARPSRRQPPRRRRGRWAACSTSLPNVARKLDVGPPGQRRGAASGRRLGTAGARGAAASTAAAGGRSTAAPTARRASQKSAANSGTAEARWPAVPPAPSDRPADRRTPAGRACSRVKGRVRPSLSSTDAASAPAARWRPASVAPAPNRPAAARPAATSRARQVGRQRGR